MSVQISRKQSNDNPNYLGYDEDHDGNWADYYRCPNRDCDGYNYLTTDDVVCPICGSLIDWIN